MTAATLKRVSCCIMAASDTCFNSIKSFHNIVQWKSPEWCRTLNNIPSHKVQLCRAKTPIHQWKLPGVETGFEVFIKRDDMTGSTLSGNKVRKLEFIFADALSRGCKHVITCGGIQSNHCRATAATAAQFGMKCHLLLRTDINRVEDACCNGNFFLDRLFGADVYFVPKTANSRDLMPRMEMLAKKIRDDSGETSRIMEVGGSDDVGFYGYLNAFHEMLQQDIVSAGITDIVYASGSGGTGEGLSVANYLTGQQLGIHGVAVSDDAAYFHFHANNILSRIGLGSEIKSEDILDIVEGYKGKCYGPTTQDGLDFICDVARQTGIALDPVYTVKAVKGMLGEMTHNPQRFKGKKILFIHTGGIFGAFDGILESTVMRRHQDQCRMWADRESPPF